jgi:hypothetical protein
VLRELTDTRSANGYEGRQGGIERRYGDDDLDVLFSLNTR